MYTLAQPKTFWNAWLRHLADMVRKRTGGVHKSSRPEPEPPAGEDVFHFGFNQPSLGVFGESDHPRIVEGFAAKGHRRFHERQRKTSVIELSVAVGNGTDEPLTTQHGHVRNRFGHAAVAARGQVSFAGNC